MKMAALLSLRKAIRESQDCCGLTKHIVLRLIAKSGNFSRPIRVIVNTKAIIAKVIFFDVDQLNSSGSQTNLGPLMTKLGIPYHFTARCIFLGDKDVLSGKRETIGVEVFLLRTKDLLENWRQKTEPLRLSIASFEYDLGTLKRMESEEAAIEKEKEKPRHPPEDPNELKCYQAELAKLERIYRDFRKRLRRAGKMAYRRDLPFLLPPQPFSDFDKGKIMEETFPLGYNLRPGDVYGWDLNPCHGNAIIISRKGDIYRVQKVS